jgi:hypothetical protein
MRKSIFTLLCAFCTVGAYAQLVNNGATITVQAGATLMVESNVDNNTGGIINLEGNAIMEIKGHFTNSNGLTGINTSPTSKIILNGTAAANFNAGGDTIANLEINKTMAGDVTMTGNAVVSKELNFNSGVASKLLLGANTLTFGANATAVVGADADEYIVTNGSGKVIKEYSSLSAFTYPVGDASNYSPLTSTPTGTPGAGANVAVNVENSAASPLPSGADAYLTRKWNVDPTAIASYGNTLVGTYIAGAEDVTGPAAKIKGAAYNTMTPAWSHIDASGTSPNVTGWTNADPAIFTGTNSFGRINVFAALAGATPVVNAGNPSGFSMSTTINGILPGSTPYNAAPWNAPVETGTITSNVVDWVLVEARDAATPATILGSRSALLLSNGSIVNPDGTELTVKDATPSSHIAIKHRNHLAIRTASTMNVIPTSAALMAGPVPPPSVNFSTNTSQAFTNSAITTNANMRNVSGIFSMWNGDVNADGTVKYNLSNNDRALIYSAIGSGNTSATVSGYRREDVNLDGIVKYNLSNNDRAAVYQVIGSGNTSATVTSHN